MAVRFSHITSVFAASLASSTALSQTVIVTDGSLGPSVSLTEPDVQIDADLGQIRRANLFHSFEQFDIGTGNRATFTGPAEIENVVSRVTGNNPSLIDGTLASTVGNADVWMVNPAGVVFGPNAGLDVPAGFHISTADQVEFSSGDVFSAVNPDASALSVAAPKAFGFLDRPRGSLLVLDGVVEVQSDEPLSLVGGDVLIDNATLSAPDGTLNVIAKTTPGRVNVADGSITGQRGGSLAISGFSLLTTAGDRGGSLRVRGDQIRIEDNSTFLASRTGSSGGAGLIDVSGYTLFLASDASISADNFADGAGGLISLRSDELQLDGEVTTDALADGDAGDIEIEGAEVALSGRVFSENLGGGAGSAGNVNIFATEVLSLTAGAQIGTSTQGSGDGGIVSLGAPAVSIEGSISGNTALGSLGNAGDVVVVGRDTLVIAPSGQIATNTEGSGMAGLILLTAPSMYVDGRISSDAGPYSVGDAGFISLYGTNDGAILLGGDISSTTSGSGAGGGIRIDAGSLYIDRRIDEVAGIVDPDTSGQIRSNTSGPGSAGSIVINALDAGIFGYVSSSALPGSTGAAGGIIITTPDEGLVDVGGSIFSNTAGSQSAGVISIQAGTLNIVSVYEAGVGDFIDGVVRSDTTADGDAGVISLSAASMTIDGEVTSDTISDGDAGIIDIAAGTFSLTGRIFSENLGEFGNQPTGDGGNVAIYVGGNATIAYTAEIGTGTDGSGRAGTVFLDAGELVIDGVISSDARIGSNGSAGAITLQAVGDMLITSNGRVSSDTNNIGYAGSISLLAGSLNIDGEVTSDTTASGDAGFIDISAERLDLRGRIFSESLFDSDLPPTGYGGNIDVIVTGPANIADSAEIGTGTDGSGPAGAIFLQVGELQLEGRVSSDARVGSTGGAGAVVLQSDGDAVIHGSGLISSNTAGNGDAGIVAAFADRLELVDGAAIRSDSSADVDPGAAGDVLVNVKQLIMNDSAIGTTGAGAAGGRIDVVANQAIRLSESTITTNGALPAEGASLLRLEAPLIEILNKSRVLSLAGDEAVPELGDSSGAATVDGVITVISDDSIIAASNNILVQGLESEVGSGLQVVQAVPTDVDRLLSSECTSVDRAKARSSFVQDRVGGTIRADPTDSLPASTVWLARTDEC